MKKLFIFSLLLSMFVSVSAQNIKSKTSSTSYLVYPKIPVENIDFDKVKVEFAHGEVVLTDDKTMHKSANLCKAKGASIKDAKALETFYYRIKYKTPEGIVRISNPDGEVLFAKVTKAKGEGVDEFGKNECYFMEAILESVYKKSKASNDSAIIASEYQFQLSTAESFINQSISFYYKPDNVSVQYPKSGKDHQYPELENAATTAVEGFNLMKGDYTNAQGKEKLQSAIEVWNNSVKDVNIQDRKARINKKIAARLYFNMANAYMYIQDFEGAQEAVAEGLKLYPSTGNNTTNMLNELSDRIYKDKRSYDLNKNAEVKVVDMMAIQNEKLVDVVYRGVEAYPEFRADVKEVSSDEFWGRVEEAKKTYDEGVASGKINPYEAKMLHSATQGYMLTVPSMTGMVTSLEDMKEAMKKLDEFPVEICELTQLNQLTLKNNNIKTIPLEIKNLENLKRFDISKNQLTELPAEIGELKELKTLIVKGNPLKSGEVEKIQSLLPDCKIKF